ncbi:Uncharacterised protein g10365 [Pycnogonum litorale]
MEGNARFAKIVIALTAFSIVNGTSNSSIGLNVTGNMFADHGDAYNFTTPTSDVFQQSNSSVLLSSSGWNVTGSTFPDDGYNYSTSTTTFQPSSAFSHDDLVTSIIMIVFIDHHHMS